MPTQRRRRVSSAIHALLILGAGAATSVCSSGGTDERSAPELSLSPAAPAFTAVEGGANPAGQAITISNSGGGTLSGLAVGTIAYGAGATGWLQPPILASTTADPSTTLTLQPITGALTPGTYTATVPVISDVASNSPETLSVTFTVSSLTCGSTAYTIGSMVTGALSPSDCSFGDGSFYDSYSFAATATTSVRINLSAATFDTFLFLTDAGGNVLAFNDDDANSTNSTFRVLLGTSSYLIDANSLSPGISGAYSLSTAIIAADVSGCEEVWVTPGISTTQAIAASDCVDASGPFYHDEYLLRIRSGQSLTVTESSPGFDPFMLLVRLDDQAVVATAGGTGTDASFTYTNPGAATYYAIVAATNLPSKTGAYTLSIQ